MRRLLVTLPLLVLAGALAPGALASSPRLVVEELGDVRGPSPTADVETGRFTLVGLHWQGSGGLEFRTRSLEGRWTPWWNAAPEAEDGPDPGSREALRSSGWRIGNPWWVGPSDRIQTRGRGPVGRVRAHLVWSPELHVPYRRLAATETPTIVPRLSWGANEAIRRAPPGYAPGVRFAIVHHTAGQNGYTRAAAPAIVKAIQLYHVQGNGWNDIGYNFLVDRFGTIYEGRYGGVDRDVVGAHAQGFNTGSVGVALLGTYGGTAPSRAAEDAIARLLAWRLDLSHVDPTGMLTVLSGGNERHAGGVPVPLRAVSGHRDTGFTQCPGDALYARLSTLAATARRTGLPKIFDPRAEATETGLRFTARLSAAAPWTVIVRDAAGAEAVRGTGSGALVAWTWDSSGAAAGTYTWTISAGTARPAVGTVVTRGEVVLAIQEVAADPSAISPNGDGQADSTVVGYRLTAAANVTVEVVDEGGAVLAAVVDRVWKRAGAHSVTVGGDALPDGRYDVVITARTAVGAEVQSVVPLVVSRTLGLVSVAPPVFSPNGDGRKDGLAVTFSLTQPAGVRVRVLREGRGVASLLPLATLPAGRQRLEWTGVRAAGPIRDGSYAVVVEVDDAVGRMTVAVPFASDTTAPRVRVLSGTPLRVEVSEPSVLTLRIDGARSKREVENAGIVRIPAPRGVARVRVVARDEAGNVSAPVLWVRPRGASRNGQ